MWISPHFQDTDFKRPWSVDDKITIFEDRILGWKLDIANQIVNGKKGTDGKEEQPPIQHGGYASLDVAISYFEMIAKYEDGFAKAGKSEDYFKEGVYLVFPVFRHPPPLSNAPGIQGNVVTLVELILDLMYEGIRCGLYHSGITSGRIMLTGGIQTPMAYDLQNRMLTVNPQLLVPKLIEHSANYINRLRDANNADLRAKFEARFDFDSHG